MPAKSQRIEVTLETLLERVDLAESISMRVAEAAGFPEEEVHKIGMAVREGVCAGAGAILAIDIEGMGRA